MANANANSKRNGWLIALGIIIVVALIMVGMYNGLVSSQESVKNAWGDVETNYQRRADLIPNLVETVKGIVGHESETFENIAKLRSGYAQAENAEELQKLDQELTSAINVAVEAYPELKSNENFLKLQDELAGTENRINIARQDYNAKATGYNMKTRRFPSNLVAKLFNFEPVELFKSAEGAENAPQVNFGAVAVYVY